MSLIRLAPILILVGMTLPATGHSAPPAQKANIEDGARILVQAMSDYLRTSKSFSFKADIQFDDLLPSGQKITFSAQSAVSLLRPNGIYSDQHSDSGMRKLWYNGREICLLDPQNTTYATEAFTGNTDKALDHMSKALRFTPPLTDFLYENPAKVLLGNTIQGFVVGKSIVNGLATTHLAFVDELIDWQVWIQDGKLPLPVRFAITYKTIRNSPQYVATFSDWDFTSRLPESLFQPVIPKGFTKLPFLKDTETAKPHQFLPKQN